MRSSYGFVRWTNDKPSQRPVGRYRILVAPAVAIQARAVAWSDAYASQVDRAHRRRASPYLTGSSAPTSSRIVVAP
jgi:hypothetical protein